MVTVKTNDLTSIYETKTGGSVQFGANDFELISVARTGSNTNGASATFTISHNLELKSSITATDEFTATFPTDLDLTGTITCTGTTSCT